MKLTRSWRVESSWGKMLVLTENPGGVHVSIEDINTGDMTALVLTEEQFREVAGLLYDIHWPAVKDPS